MNKIKFIKLFGRFNYEIELKEGITIITGPNGYGKSTILRCIEAIQKGIEGIIYLISLDFEKIEIFLSENDTLTIKKDDSKLYIDRTSVNIEDFYKKITRLAYRLGPYLRHIDDENFIDRRSGRIYEMKEIISNKKILNYILDSSISMNELFSTTFINKLKSIQDRVGNIFLIKEQRLLLSGTEKSRLEDRIINFIEELPEKLKKQIGKTSEKYSKMAYHYDSTYPYRLFNEKNGINKLEYEEKMKEIKEKFNKLKEYDISEGINNRKLEFKQEFSTALKVYVDDFNDKYKVYEELINKLDLYISIINSRLTFKKIKISRETGIEIINDEQQKLKLSDLSSGEQQEIVLFYKLIFEAPNQSLLLIDEPEISLHIVWQKIFMNDLQKVVDLKNLNVIVATHSPQIINNYWDNQIDLGELYGN